MNSNEVDVSIENAWVEFDRVGEISHSNADNLLTAVTNIKASNDRMADEIAELRAKIAKKDEMVSDLIEALGASVDEASEFREFVSMVAAGDSASNEVKSFMIHTYIHNAKQLLNK